MLGISVFVEGTFIQLRTLCPLLLKFLGLSVRY